MDRSIRSAAAAMGAMAAVVVGGGLLMASGPGWEMPWAWGWFALGIGGTLLTLRWFRQDRLDMRSVLIGAVLLRLLMLPFPPLTSDDFFRYLWDGIVQNQGISPYQYVPSDPALDHLHGLKEFQRMNSSEYFSVYPPLSQAIFHFAASIRSFGFQASYSLMKLLMMLPEVAGLLALARMVRPRDLMLYAWNPIVVIALVGQGHTETAMAGLLLVTVWAVHRSRPFAASLSLAGAGLIKLYPFVLFPLLVNRFGWRRAAPGAVVSAAWMLLTFDRQTLGHYLSSLRLYLSHFEFYAGPYFALREAGWKWLTVDPRPLVTAVLSTAFAATTIRVWWQHRRDRLSLPAAVVVILGTYLVCSRTLHPWYLSGLLALLPLVHPRWRWPWLWLLAGGWGTYLFYVDRGTYWPFVWIGWSGWLAGLLWAGFGQSRLHKPLDPLVQRLLRRRAASKARVLRPRLTSLLADHNGQPLRLLDIGAAEGYLGEELARTHGAEVELVDIDDHCRSSLPHRVYDGVKLPYPDQRFDVTVSSYVLHHAEDPVAVLREIRRVTSRRVLIVESWARSPILRKALVFVDRLANSLRGGGWDAPITYRSLDAWSSLAEELGYRPVGRRDLGGWFHARLYIELDPDHDAAFASGFPESPAAPVCRQTMVLIPALDEEEALPGVLAELQRWPFGGIRVIDNGSVDLTAQRAREAGTQVVRENARGYGAACWRGMKDLPPDIGWILFCDADGSDDLRALEPFFAAAADGHDLILGNRNAVAASRAALTLPQQFGNRLAGFLIARRWGQRFHDLGPLRLIRRSSLERLAMEDRGFGWTVEMQAKAAMHGMCCLEIPIAYSHRRGGRSKIAGTFVGTLKAGTVILLTLGKLFLRRR